MFFNPGNHALMLTARFLLTPFMHLHIPYPLEGSIMTKCLSISLVCIIGTKLNYEYKYVLVIVKANWQPCGFSELACLPACLPAGDAVSRRRGAVSSGRVACAPDFLPLPYQRLHYSQNITRLISG